LVKKQLRHWMYRERVSFYIAKINNCMKVNLVLKSLKGCSEVDSAPGIQMGSKPGEPICSI
jgi:hypothetical protein